MSGWVASRSFRTGVTDGVIAGLFAGPLALIDPFTLWLGHALLHFAVPTWAYVAVWLIAYDSIAGRLADAAAAVTDAEVPDA